MIKIFDDAMGFKFRQHAMSFAHNSYFRIGWADDNFHRGHSYLHSPYSEEDIKTLGIDVELEKTGIVLDDYLKNRVKGAIMRYMRYFRLASVT